MVIVTAAVLCNLANCPMFPYLAMVTGISMVVSS